MPVGGRFGCGDVGSGREGAALNAHTGPVYSVSYSPDGNRLAVATSSGIWCYDAHRVSEVALLNGLTNDANSMSLSPDGTILASASGDSTIRLWDVPGGQLRATLAKHKTWVRWVYFSPDGRTLASTSGDSTIQLWDVPGGQLRATLARHGTRNRWVSYSPDGLTLASFQWGQYGSFVGRVQWPDQGHHCQTWELGQLGVVFAGRSDPGCCNCRREHSVVGRSQRQAKGACIPS